MPLKVACPAGHKMIVPGDRAGQPLTCPRCGATFVAGHPDAGEPAANASVNEAAVAAPPVAPKPAGSPLPVIIAPKPAAAEPRWKPATWLLAAVMVAAAIFSIAPAVYDLAEAVRLAGLRGGVWPARWALMLVLLGAIQAAYGIYLFQLPDWASVRVIAVALVALAGIYAAGLAMVLLADPRGWIAGGGGLQFADKLPGGKAALWCLCLVSTSTILAFLAARLSARWRRAEIVFRRAARP